MAPEVETSFTRTDGVTPNGGTYTIESYVAGELVSVEEFDDQDQSVARTYLDVAGS